MTPGDSLAVRQRPVGERGHEYPLYPVLTAGCPETSTADLQHPVEVDYEYAELPDSFFDRPPLPGISRWGRLLPPLADGLGLGEGGTPLLRTPELADAVGFDGDLYVKDESRNPTWSHKDRSNRLAVGAAVRSGAGGVVVASSGNHGASAAAYASRAGLSCVLLLTGDAPGAVKRFVRSYGAAAVSIPHADAGRVMERVVDELGFHPVSNRTETPTGHPFGPEGYKTIAYEVYRQLGGQAPGTVFVPTGYGELIFGVWKGFAELHRYGPAAAVPRMVACEPAARAPLATALSAGVTSATVEAKPTGAGAIAALVNGVRPVHAVERSDGYAAAVTDGELSRARDLLAGTGLWQELSGAAGLAGLEAALADGRQVDGPVVCLATSSGFKDGTAAEGSVPAVDSEWEAVRAALSTRYGIEA